MVRRVAFIIFLLFSALLLWASWQQRIPIALLEAVAFVTGAACVWLTVEENIWNWPLGIANSGFFLFLFLEKRLFADGTLQILYIVLGFLGWYWWLRGGKNQSVLMINRVSRVQAIVLLVIGAAATTGMSLYLQGVKDAAPFLDALTTTLSLIAQFMLTRKHLENWFVWMTADLVYIGLYASRKLYLTSALYAIFFAMCVAGYLQWRRSMQTIIEPAHG